MDSSPLECGLCASESTAFALICQRHGFRPEQFQVSVADAVDRVGFTVVLERAFVVTQRSCGRRRCYRADLFSSGFDAFESDLRAGVFFAWASFDFA